MAMLLHRPYDMPLLVLNAAGAEVVNALAFIALALVALPSGLLLGMGSSPSCWCSGCAGTNSAYSTRWATACPTP